MVQLPAEEIPVERDVVYEAAEMMTQIPETLEFALEDGGRTAKVSCWAEKQEEENARWSDDFSFPVVFHGCDASFCQLGDVLIPYREEKPELEGEERQLLEMIHVPEEGYRITDISWNGTVYEDEQGELCREALAEGEKLVRDVLVHYVGIAEFPDGEGWQITAQYDLALPKISETQVAILETKSDFASSEPEKAQAHFWKNVVYALTISISLLIVILVFAAVWAKRRKKE